MQSMRTSQLCFPTLKEAPMDASIISQQLMVRAGMITKLASGIYSWLPLGLRVLRKVESLVREEMDRIGGQEVLLPIIQPSELWKKTGRWGLYGSELFRLEDRHQQAFCLGPTHEEVITDLLRNRLQSYKHLPVIFYQIQIKFRDEVRPRFGLMRAREFLMKDAYSFHLTKESLADTYNQMRQSYIRILDKLHLYYRIVKADSGNIGGGISEEFQVLAEIGENQIFYSDESDYAANVELASSWASENSSMAILEVMEKVSTPDIKTVAELTAYLSVNSKKILKIVLVKGKNQPAIGLILRGDHELNTLKAEKLPQVFKPLHLLTLSEIESLDLPADFIGPVALSIPFVVDREAAVLSNFMCGANEKGYHLKGVNWNRDAPLLIVADLRNVVVGDRSPDGKGRLKMTRGIEVGHIFQLGDRYSRAMDAYIVNQKGKRIPIEMGCYGLGISRIVAAIVEQHHDERGIIWPKRVAPFQIAIVPIGYHRSESVRLASEQLYKELTQHGLEVLLDDRDLRPGIAFSEIELIGIPCRLVISEQRLKEKQMEYKGRHDPVPQYLEQTALLEFLRTVL